ncbi:hypothetical protein HFN_2341 [Helicobacter fennelliae MRY12-0050]|uniref:Uncharacterized protein n=1 Tax=Helicobacter fennelliae MRY12-0050 TaxID=1325130 RepID=T1DV49_9HELI|nr:hypothetical protein HFN_2341 [Helicobacter fennelliae MRY12-0050]
MLLQTLFSGFFAFYENLSNDDKNAMPNTKGRKEILHF